MSPGFSQMPWLGDVADGPLARKELEELRAEVERLEGMLFVAEKILTQRPNSELPYSHVGLLKRIAALRATHEEGET